MIINKNDLLLIFFLRRAATRRKGECSRDVIEVATPMKNEAKELKKYLYWL